VGYIETRYNKLKSQKAYNKDKVKQSRYRHGVAQRVPGS
jgi:hypothetical protein